MAIRASIARNFPAVDSTAPLYTDSDRQFCTSDDDVWTVEVLITNSDITWPADDIARIRDLDVGSNVEIAYPEEAGETVTILRVA